MIDRRKSMLKRFYDQLSPYYKYIFQDWNASVVHQAAILDEVILTCFVGRVHFILDAACGIGTQTIGLAQRGYRLTASDISAAEVEKARAEASQRGLKIDFHIADMRNLQQTFQAKFDLVIACDNAIPHLLSEDEIVHVFQQFYQVTSDFGGCLISVRDYEAMERGGKKLYPRQVHDIPGGRLVLFDCWEFDGDFYDLTMYLVEDTGQATVQTHVIRGGRYYCVPIPKLEMLMMKAGFKSVVTLKDRFYQPLIIGLKS